MLSTTKFKDHLSINGVVAILKAASKCVGVVLFYSVNCPLWNLQGACFAYCVLPELVSILTEQYWRRQTSKRPK